MKNIRWTDEELELLFSGDYKTLHDKYNRTYGTIYVKLLSEKKNRSLMSSLHYVNKGNKRAWTQTEIDNLLDDNLDALRKNGRSEIAILGMLRKIENNPDSKRNRSEERKTLDETKNIKVDKELYRLQKQNAILKKQLKEILSSSTTSDEITEAIRSVSSILSDKFDKTPHFVPELLDYSEHEPETAVLLLSDLHIGEVIELGELNRYDISVYKKRVSNLTNNIISIYDRLEGYEFDKLVIMGLGDYVSGEIHNELRETNYPVIVESVLEGASILFDTIRHLVPLFPKIKICSICGNHGRLREKPPHKNSFNNWDYIFAKSLEGYFSDYPTVEFMIPRQPYFVERVKKWEFYGWHGDGIKSYNNIPYYGINRYITGVQSAHSKVGRKLDYFVLGHFHTPAVIELSSASVLINGSLCGANEYSYDRYGMMSSPSQTFFSVHDKYGITFKFDVRVE